MDFILKFTIQSLGQKKIRQVKKLAISKKFTFFEGKKYLKVIMNDYNDITKKYDGRGVHCFIDKFTGQVFKASSWKAPAKGVRFDMRIMRERALMHNSNFTDWAGGYLYAR